MLLKMTNNLQRRYVISSSFKMALLFTVLLSLSLISWTYILFKSSSQIHLTALIIAITCTFSVVLISFLISFFVVRKINEITNTAISIVNTQDLSRRIAISTKWDDLSNLAHVLNTLLSNIESLLEDIRNISSNVAHDLRTPLTKLKNDLITLNKNNPSNETQKALDNCEQILNIFNNILKINRLSTGSNEILKQKVNIANIVNDAIELYEPIIEEKSIVISKKLTNKNLNIDKNLFFQSIVNILDNSLKYSATNTKIDIKSYINHNYYHIEISDQGCGINPKNSDKIFNRFFREEKSRSNKGNGLGLTLVKKVIELHNGGISAVNNEHQGLTIKISLPLR